MSKGYRSPPSQADCVVLPFTLAAAGADTKTFSSTTETALAVGYHTSTGESNTLSHAGIPFPCRISAVTFQGEALASGDEFHVRVRRHDSDPNGAAAQCISNYSGSGSVLNYIRSVATAANQPFGVYYTGPQSEGSTAEGFVEAQAIFDTTDFISCSIDAEAAADSVSHVRVFVTLSRIG